MGFSRAVVPQGNAQGIRIPPECRFSACAAYIETLEV
jgi:hypothetical protein